MSDKFKVVSMAEIEREPLPDKGFTMSGNCVVVRWGGYPYRIEFVELDTPLKVLTWLAHMGEKGWDGMTPWAVRSFIECLGSRNGWDVYEGKLHANRGTSADVERAKLTPKLRYSILQRDGYRCRACGRDTAHGAILHIDHIHPISRGGLTEPDNLRALCQTCNQGKGAN